jgi:hypothetical protein
MAGRACKAKWPKLPIAEDEWLSIESLDDIPQFQNECEEAAYWANHTFSEALLEAFEEVWDGDKLTLVLELPAQYYSAEA